MQVLRQNKYGAEGMKMGSTSGGTNYTQHQHAQQTQGLTALLVMIAVLCILLAYCLWGAPWCRAFCRRRVCCLCPMDEPPDSRTESQANQEPNQAATPTIILLPFGRMLVVDGSVIAQLQADSRGGLDLMELGENIIRNQRYQTGSTPSILQIDSETTSKGLPSPLFDFPPPPTYDSIFGSRFYVNDLPPSYSDVDLHLRNLANQGHVLQQEALLREFNNRQEEAMALRQEVANLHQEAILRNLADEEEQAMAMHQEALALQQEVSNLHQEAILRNLANEEAMCSLQQEEFIRNQNIEGVLTQQELLNFHQEAMLRNLANEEEAHFYQEAMRSLQQEAFLRNREFEEVLAMPQESSTLLQEEVLTNVADEDLSLHQEEISDSLMPQEALPQSQEVTNLQEVITGDLPNEEIDVFINVHREIREEEEICGSDPEDVRESCV